ncbi:hypothetical protein Rsub_08448 [Raphidocelis subcapitata]|uniref:Uncharacterized protein n=1 Tax=Raphidocelis subcapitata TaxID=307507 RepID=A0A2V0PF86_9CHLO|nr:hypothetical protein Rsub_08448 [Raphidocelis subcapitata]|eukprot:GBF95857.1 hypothetical protein Rsub_08448 [Raphidocelis subcapitata]
MQLRQAPARPALARAAGGTRQRLGAPAPVAPANSRCRLPRPPVASAISEAVLAAPARAAAPRRAALARRISAAPAAVVALPGAAPRAAAAPHGPRPPRAAVPVGVVDVPPEEEIALPLPRAVESAADDPLLHNPLQRMERLGTGWFGVIADYEGVLVDSTVEVHKEAWRQVAVEMNLPVPLGSTLNRINGLRDEVIIMQLLTWTRNPGTAAAIAARKEEIYDQLMNGNAPAEVPGMRPFLEMLANFNIPVALASPLSERRVRPAIDRLDLGRAFAAVVTGEDNSSPELELTYLTACHQIARPPLRCVVVGDSNRSVEAARELGMKSVVVTGGQPAWNFGGADLVVRSVSALTFSNMRSLFGQEELVESTTPWEEIRAERKREEEEALSRGGGGFSRAGSVGSVGSAASSGFSSSTAGGGYAASGGGSISSGGSWREQTAVAVPAAAPAPAPATVSASASASASSGGSQSVSMQEAGEDEFVVLPPPGAACWD